LWNREGGAEEYFTCVKPETTEAFFVLSGFLEKRGGRRECCSALAPPKTVGKGAVDLAPKKNKNLLLSF
jgi:hypothetical protein